jgi:hypothetical protein
MDDDTASTDETVWYRADLFGIPPGEEASFSQDWYVYAVSDLKAARALRPYEKIKRAHRDPSTA